MSPSQIILRWHLQDGHIAIPVSHNPDYIRENSESIGFGSFLSHRARINALGKNKADVGFSTKFLQKFYKNHKPSRPPVHTKEIG